MLSFTFIVFSVLSNSNYSIGLQRLKPVHTAYCCVHSLAENWSWARDVNGRDRDETETSASRDGDETETLTIFLETRPRRDVGTSGHRLETETSRPRPQPWRLNILTGLSSSLFVRWTYTVSQKVPTFKFTVTLSYFVLLESVCCYTTLGN